MGILKKLFGQKKESSSSPKEEAVGVEKQPNDSKKTGSDALALKFDGLKALRMGNLRFALLALEQALAISPEFETRFYYAQALQGSGQSEEALEQYDRLVEEIPKHLSARMQRASLRLEQDLCQEALEDLEAALLLTDVAEELALIYRLRAQVFLGLKRYEDAVKDADKAEASHGGDAKVLLVKSRALILLDREDEALVLIQTSKEQFPEEERFLLHEAQVEEKRGNKEAAEKLFHHALELDPFNEEAVAGLVRLFQATGKTEEAAKLLSDFIESCSVSRGLQMLFVEVLRKNGEEKKAAKIEAAIEGEESEVQNVDFGKLYEGGIF